MSYVKPKIASEKFGVSVQTLRKWADKGQIDYIRGPGNGRLFNISSIIPTTTTTNENGKVIYCRVSCNKQKEDLERQVAYLKDKYPTHEVISEISSGINFKRKGIQRLLDRAINGSLKELVVAHKDRLCRIAWDHFNWLFVRLGVNVVVEDREEHSPETELADDLFTIIHVFSSRHYGQRRKYTSKRDAEQITEIETKN